MKLDEFYKLRTEFTVIGLTGRVGGGCSLVASKLANPEFARNLPEPNFENVSPEAIKYKICHTFLTSSNNWQPYEVIVYKDVILLHLLFYAYKNLDGRSLSEAIVSVIVQNGNSKRAQFRNRFDLSDGQDATFFRESFLPFLTDMESYIETIAVKLNFKSGESLNAELKDKPDAAFEIFFNSSYKKFSNKFFDLLNRFNVIRRTRLIHDLANNLRMTGGVETDDEFDYQTEGLRNIYTVAETINRLIKGFRRNTRDGTRIVIDSLKNSLELMYFKEKYSAFYMIATNQEDYIRREHVGKVITEKLGIKDGSESIVSNIISLDDDEYKANDFKSGRFASPDIENCIQKSDYHIFIDNSSIPPLERQGEPGNDNISTYFSLNFQLLKLMSLIKQPGIVTPSIGEHFMQVAYNAKFNSGCISRQVGAVVTDESFSIKAIGWNDVPEGQTPCNMRNIDDLTKGQRKMMFSSFEREGNYKGKGTFVELARAVVPDSYNEHLNGRNCSFCFKSFHNAFENDKNQVHTRSLHAEENAMMQITKFGGQGIKGGNLFTTASPCELCSKKAFQLGIRNIYYIDPYPGIARTQILQAASIEGFHNPQLVMFQGAVGRAFHKLYEPFMAYKDEISILTGINPTPRLADQLEKIIADNDVMKDLEARLNGKTDEEKQVQFLHIIKSGLKQD